MSFRRVRAGELLALVGAACVIVSLFRPWYESPTGTLDAWETFGPAMVLIIVAALAALVLVLAPSPSAAPPCRSPPPYGPRCSG